MTGDRERASWLVAIEHGEQPLPALEALLDRARRRTGCHVERVRTDLAPGQALSDPNEAFEFSGYQEGLARVLAQVREKNGRDDPMTVVFVNDTIATGHVRPLARLLLDALACLRQRVWSGPLVVGLKMPAPAALQGVSLEHGYISSWAFVICARPSLLQAVHFYARGEVLAQFRDETQPGLPAAYRDWVARWLEPRGLLRGWYQAVPGQRLDSATMRRKELAIFLEHSLLPRLHALGFEVHDVGAVLPGHRAAWLRMLRWMDRLNTHRLKLQRRMPALLAMRRA